MRHTRGRGNGPEIHTESRDSSTPAVVCAFWKGGKLDHAGKAGGGKYGSSRACGSIAQELRCEGEGERKRNGQVPAYMPLMTWVRSEFSWLALRSWDSFLHCVGFGILLATAFALNPASPTPHGECTRRGRRATTVVTTTTISPRKRGLGLLLLPGLCLRLPGRCICGPLITCASRSSVHRRRRSRQRSAGRHLCTP